jgi:hypothetical protein
MKALTYSQLRKYSQATSIYLRVEAYNLNIFNLRKAGDLSKTYYVFTSSDEETQYKLGLFLLNQNNPSGNYRPIQKI